MNDAESVHLSVIQRSRRLHVVPELNLELMTTYVMYISMERFKSNTFQMHLPRPDYGRMIYHTNVILDISISLHSRNCKVPILCYLFGATHVLLCIQAYNEGLQQHVCRFRMLLYT